MRTCMRMPFSPSSGVLSMDGIDRGKCDNLAQVLDRLPIGHYNTMCPNGHNRGKKSQITINEQKTENMITWAKEEPGNREYHGRKYLHDICVKILSKEANKGHD